MSVAHLKATAFSVVNLIDWKKAILQTDSKFDETSSYGTVSSKQSEILKFVIFGVIMWPRQIKTYVEINFEMYINLYFNFDKNHRNSRIGLRDISHCVQNRGIWLGATVVGFDLEFG